MSKDIIYRKDVIEAIHSYWKGELSKMPTTDSKYGEVIDGDCNTLLKHNKELSTRIKNIPSVFRLQGDTLSRQYLLAEIDDLADEFAELDENGLHSERWCGISDSKRIIMNAPSVSNRPQGEWETEYHGNGWNDYWDYTCSNCGKKYEKADAVLYKANFCPNCGARMEGANNENV